MKKLPLFLLLILVYLYSNSVLLSDKIISVETEGTSIIGDGITISDAKTFAINYAKQAALEMVGTYLESNTTIVNHMVEKDEIKTFTGSVLKTEVLKEEKCMIENNFAFKVKIKATIDTELLNKRISETRNNNELLTKFKKERERVEELTRQVSELEKRKNVSKEESKQIANSLTASDWHSKGYSLHISKNYIEATAAYTKAIELDPKSALAYANRGVSYIALTEYQQAIADYTKAIELEPKSAGLYTNRGITYNYLTEYQKAIADFTKAIELEPKYTSAYNNRGSSYYALKEYQKSISDYTKAIELEPKTTFAYINRAVSYFWVKEYQKSISDYTKVIELVPKSALTYANRAVSYYALKEYQKSTSDYNEYLRLNGNKNGDAESVRQIIKSMGFEPKY